MPRIILTQLEWSAGEVPALRGALAAILADARRNDAGGEPEDPVLVLLPMAPRPAPDERRETLPRVEELLARCGELASSLGIFIAGAAFTQAQASEPASAFGFLVDAQGRVLLCEPKRSPELVDGFGEESSVLGAEAQFAVARTPFGQIGLLPGEDVLFAPLARALVFRGAELLLNPCIERNDERFEMRRLSRMVRAGENTAYVATASPASRSTGGIRVGLPPATAFYGFLGTALQSQGGGECLYPDLDLDLLRRARINPHRSLPAIVRAPLYARALRSSMRREAPSTAPCTREQWRREGLARIAAQRQCFPSRHARHEEQYEALLVQHCARLIPLDRSVDATAIIERNLDEALELAGSRANVPSVRLVVFPEFWLTGPGGIGGVQRSVEDMERLAIRYPGRVFDRISSFAQAHRVYVAFQNFETHPKFPRRVFNSAFLIDDAGTLVHTYRKNQCADVWGLLPDTTPGSILTQYLDVFGEQALFPVADTPLGRLANMICFDAMIPEVAQGLRRAGAEIILHSSSEPHGGAGREVWDAARRVRAFENCCYLLSAIDGGEHVRHDSDALSFFRRGHSRIVRFDGRVEGTADGPGPVAFRVGIDLAALRRARARPEIDLALWDDPTTYARAYEADVGLPNDLWAADPTVNPYAGAAALRERIASYLERGIYVAPSAPRTRESLPDSI